MRDRDELAEAFALVLATDTDSIDSKDCATLAYKYADALIARRTPPAPSSGTSLDGPHDASGYLDKPAPTPPVAKFKVGDRVSDASECQRGDGVVVLLREENPSVRVKWDAGFCPESWRWTSELELVPPPVAPPAASEASDPRRVVGAVISDSTGREFIVVETNNGGGVRGLGAKSSDPSMGLYDSDTFSRWATREECDRHGIPYVERGAASEAKPTHVRIDIYCEPKVRPVLAWHDGQPTVPSSIDGRLDPSELCYPPKGSWEPCAPPVADAAQPTHVLVDEAMCEIGGRVLPVESWLSDKCPRVRSGSMVYTLGAGAWTPATPTASPAAKPTTPAADFDEKREREAARAAYARGDDGSSVQYAACLDSFINGWLSRARSGAGR